MFLLALQENLVDNRIVPSRHAQDAAAPATLLTLSVVVCLASLGPAAAERLATPTPTRPAVLRQDDEAVHTLLASLSRAVRQVCQHAHSMALLIYRPGSDSVQTVQRPAVPVLLSPLDHVGLHLLNLPPPAAVA